MTSHPSHTNVKNKFLKPEETSCLVDYAMTINPNDDHQFFTKNSVCRLPYFVNHIRLKLSEHLKPFCDYRFNVEISSGGRLHLHGTIRIRNVFDFYLKVPYYLSTMSASEMDTINDPEVWTKYCTKQEPLFVGLEDELMVIDSKAEAQEKAQQIVDNFFSQTKTAPQRKLPKSQYS